MYTGVLNIYKQKGYTSNDVVQIVKKLTKSKAGHTGTLDPDARGVLPICLGKATKIADYIMATEKEYIATVVLGTATDTADAAGAVVARASFEVDKSQILAILPQFLGEIQQIPPIYSAIKIKGKKLYQYARAGQEIEVQPRKVTINSLEILKFNADGFVVRVRCSKGTYIRSLCADMGVALGTYAHMGSLLRTSSGNFNLNSSISLVQLKSITKKSNIENFIATIEATLGGMMPKISISSQAKKLLINGNKIPLEFVQNLENPSDTAPRLTFDHEGNLAGIFHVENDFLKPKTMLI